MKKIPTFLEFVSDGLHGCYGEYKTENLYEEGDEFYQGSLAELIKCEASEEYKTENKEKYNDINRGMNKGFSEDTKTEIMNAVYRHVNELKDKYSAILLDESYGI